MQIFQTWGVPSQWTNKAPSHHAAAPGGVGTGRVVCPGLSYRFWEMRSIVIASTGQRTAHSAQPVQLPASCRVACLGPQPLGCCVCSDSTCGGHTPTHQPQPVQRPGLMAGKALRGAVVTVGPVSTVCPVFAGGRFSACRAVPPRAVRVTSCACFSSARLRIFSAPSFSIGAVWRGPAPATTGRPHAP